MSSPDSFVFKNQDGEFVLESDSLNLYYSFNGENAPINIGVYNKTSKPLYIDWRRSGLVIDEHLVTFREPLEVYAMYADTTTANYNRYLNDPDGISLVKTGTRLDTQVLELANFNFDQIPKDNFKDRFDSNGNYKGISYTVDDSPIYIETFLFIYEDVLNMSRPWVFEGVFYMSELEYAKNGKPSGGLYKNRANRGDFFYVSDINNEVHTEPKKRKGKKTNKLKAITSKALGAAATIVADIEAWALDGHVK